MEDSLSLGKDRAIEDSINDTKTKQNCTPPLLCHDSHHYQKKEMCFLCISTFLFSSFYFFFCHNRCGKETKKEKVEASSGRKLVSLNWR